MFLICLEFAFISLAVHDTQMIDYDVIKIETVVFIGCLLRKITLCALLFSNSTSVNHVFDGDDGDGDVFGGVYLPRVVHERVGRNERVSSS